MFSSVRGHRNQLLLLCKESWRNTALKGRHTKRRLPCNGVGEKVKFPKVIVHYIKLQEKTANYANYSDIDDLSCLCIIQFQLRAKRILGH